MFWHATDLITKLRVSQVHQCRLETVNDGESETMAVGE